MRKAHLILILVAGSLLFWNCSTRYGALTVATTKNVDINRDSFTLVEKGVTGKNTKPIIIFIPTGTPSIEDAIDAALDEYGGDLMENVVIYYKWFYIPYIYGEYTFEVKGDVWKLTNSETGAVDPAKLENAKGVYKTEWQNGMVHLVEVQNIQEVIE